jgi:hypothetical protein
VEIKQAYCSCSNISDGGSSMSYTEIIIPKNLGDRDLLNFFQRWRWLEDPKVNVTIDFREVNFIAPWAVTLLSAYALWLNELRDRRVTALLNPDSIAGRYLIRTGFSELLGGPSEDSSKLIDHRMTKLTRITKSTEIPTFTTSVMQLLQIDDPEIEGAVKYSLVELLRNVLQHSRSSIGGVAMAQYYPNTGLVDLVVVDMGVGIKNTLQTKYKEIDNDLRAIKFATQPHVSGTFAPGAYAQMKENAGLGLFFIKQIVTLSGGGFLLGSGEFIGNIWGDREGKQQKVYRRAAREGWMGTFAVIQLRRDTIADFDSVLRVCREQAEQARKDPTELSLDFLNDIPELEDLLIVKVIEFEENVEEAARIRDSVITPAINEGRMVVLDFSGIRFATQSFVHALMYKVLRDCALIASSLSIANCTKSTREAILAVAGYAKISDAIHPEWS